jgi:hypothetical protein
MGTYKKSHPGAQRAERSIQICLRADLVAEHEAADRELKRARDEGRVSDSKESSGLGDLIERVRALEAQMLEEADTWVLRAMPRHKFRALVDAHEPRRGDDGEPLDEDRQLGLNRDTFFPALIRASVITPELDDEDWAWLLGDEEAGEDGVLTDRQFGDLEDTAWFLNRGEVKVPFSHAASLASRDSDGE